MINIKNYIYNRMKSQERILAAAGGLTYEKYLFIG